MRSGSRLVPAGASLRRHEQLMSGLERSAAALVTVTVVVIAGGSSWNQGLQSHASSLRWVALSALAFVSLSAAATRINVATPSAAERRAAALGVGLVLLMLASATWSVDARISFERAVSFALLVVTVGAIAYAAARSSTLVTRVLGAIVVAIALLVVASILSLAVDSRDSIEPGVPRLRGIEQNPDTLPLLASYGLPLAGWMIVRERRPRARAAFGALIVLILVLLGATGSRGGLLAGLAGTALFATALVGTRRRIVIALPVLAALFAATLAIAPLVGHLPGPPPLVTAPPSVPLVRSAPSTPARSASGPSEGSTPAATTAPATPAPPTTAPATTAPTTLVAPPPTTTTTVTHPAQTTPAPAAPHAAASATTQPQPAASASPTNAPASTTGAATSPAPTVAAAGATTTTAATKAAATTATPAVTQQTSTVAPPPPTAASVAAANALADFPGSLADEIGHSNFYTVHGLVHPLFSSSGRVGAWIGALRQADERPALGYGFGTEDRVFIDRYNGFQSQRVENSWIGMYLQLGAVGVIGLAALIATTLITGLRAFWRSTGAARLQIAAIGGVVLAGLVETLVQSYVYSVGDIASLSFWLCAALLIAAAGPGAVRPRAEGRADGA